MEFWSERGYQIVTLISDLIVWLRTPVANVVDIPKIVFDLVPGLNILNLTILECLLGGGLISFLVIRLICFILDIIN